MCQSYAKKPSRPAQRKSDDECIEETDRSETGKRRFIRVVLVFCFKRIMHYEKQLNDNVNLTMIFAIKFLIFVAV